MLLTAAWRPKGSAAGLWTPEVLAVQPLAWFSAQRAVWAGANLESHAGFALAGTPTKGTTQNNISPIRFDVDTEGLTRSLALTSGVLFYFWIGKRLDAGAVTRGLFGKSWAMPTGSLAVYLAGDGTTYGTRGPGYTAHLGDGYTAYTSETNNPPIFFSAGGNVIADTNWHSMAGRMGAVNGLWKDSVAATLEDSLVGAVPSYSSTLWQFGRSSANSEGSNADWGEFLLFNYMPGTNDLQRIEGWAHHVYGIQSLLPSGHPYRNQPPSMSDTPVSTAPAFTQPPSISGASTVGSTLSRNASVVTGSPTPTVTWQWRRNGVAVGAANAPTMNTTGFTAGDLITIMDTAANGVLPNATSTSATITLTGVPLPGMGPLTVHPVNQRYFADSAGNLVYLSGSHGQNTFTRHPGSGWGELDFPAYVNFLVANGHNFAKLRSWERIDVTPNLWQRTGPGNCVGQGGGLKYNLALPLNPAFLTRLRDRVSLLNDNNIYACVMLFHWGENLNVTPTTNTFFLPTNHPFHPGNNINPSVVVDTDGDGKFLELNTLGSSSSLAIQDAYVRQQIDAINEFPNVIWEIANEADYSNVAQTKLWQFHMTDLIQNYESTKPLQHPVMVSFLTVAEAQTTANHAEANSPRNTGAGVTAFTTTLAAVPATQKITMIDCDHINWWTVCPVDPYFGRHWVWKAFLRGYHVIPLESLPSTIAGSGSGYPCHGNDAGSNAIFASARLNMGYTIIYSRLPGFPLMTPSTTLASTAFVLARAGFEYLVYQPGTGAFTVNLSANSSTYTVQWRNPATGAVTAGANIVGGSSQQSFTPPFAGDAVLYLKAL